MYMLVSWNIFLKDEVSFCSTCAIATDERELRPSRHRFKISYTSRFSFCIETSLFRLHQARTIVRSACINLTIGNCILRIFKQHHWRRRFLCLIPSRPLIETLMHRRRCRSVRWLRRLGYISIRLFLCKLKKSISCGKK